MANFQLRYFLLLFFLLFGLQPTLHAQQTLGVKWEVPTNSDSAQKQLDEFREIGISALEISTVPSKEVWKHIDSLQFEVYANMDISFPLTSTFADPDSVFLEHIRQQSEAFLSQPSIRAIGLFNHGNIFNDSFWKAATPFAEELRKAESNLYHKSRTATHTDTSVISSAIITVPVTPSNYESLILPEANILGYEYSPSPKIDGQLTPFKHFITTVPQDVIVFLDSDWVQSITEKHPQVPEILSSIVSGPEPVFPLPQEKIPSPETTSFPIIALLLIWATIALHYNLSPLYRKSLFRYFFAHKFFIDDIFKRLIRSSLPAVVILVQSALLIALAIYSTFSSLLTPLGQDAFFYHFPNIALVGDHGLSIVIGAFALILLISFVGITWLYLTHKKIKSITQIAIVYAWPLQLNFLFCTVAVTFSSSTEPFTAIFFTALAVVLFLLSFIFAAMDIGRFSRAKMIYHLKTTIPYVLIIAGFLGWALSSEEWIEVLSLAINLT